MITGKNLELLLIVVYYTPYLSEMESGLYPK